MDRKLAAQLFNVFGYVNVNSDMVTILETKGRGFTTTYLKVELDGRVYQFKRNARTESTSWIMSAVH